jgi:hypothetical protein
VGSEVDGWGQVEEQGDWGRERRKPTRCFAFASGTPVLLLNRRYNQDSFLFTCVLSLPKFIYGPVILPVDSFYAYFCCKSRRIKHGTKF